MSNNSDTQAQPKGPSAEHKRLALFLGKWNAEGRTNDGRVVKIQAVDTYEWLPGEYFLMHCTDARVGDDEYKSTEIVGYDAESKTYPMRFFDSWGQTGTYEATVDGNTWTYIGETGRATVMVSDDGNSMTAHWEMSENGTDWQPWMDLNLTRTT